MATKRVNKQALTTDELIFDNQDDNEKEAISPSYAYNFIDVVSLDAIGGSPITPSSGEYRVYVQTDINGGFKTLSGGNIIKATETGGTSLSDGVQEGLYFAATPLKIKVVPLNVNAPAYQVYITQLSDQLDTTPADFKNAFVEVDGAPSLRVKVANGLLKELTDEVRLLQEINQEVIEQLKLLNARVEEIGDTEIEDSEDEDCRY